MNEQWALPQLSELLPLDESELRQIIQYSSTLSDTEATEHLSNLLGDSPQALQFITAFNQRRADSKGETTKMPTDIKGNGAIPSGPPPGYAGQTNGDQKTQSASAPMYAPPSGPPPATNGDTKAQPTSASTYAPPSHPPPASGSSRVAARNYTNQVIEAGKVRARDEQEMQQALQNLQFQYNIYNSEIEPEHEVDYPCGCDIHQYQARKWRRLGVQEMWSKAVMYPGEKSYNDSKYNATPAIFSSNPYRFKVVSPYGYYQTQWGASRPRPAYHAQSIHQTIDINNALNREAQQKIDAKEPKHDIWNEQLDVALQNLGIDDKKKPIESPASNGYPEEKLSSSKRASLLRAPSSTTDANKGSKMSRFKKSLGMKSAEESAVEKGKGLRESILAEENGRWPDAQWRNIVSIYQEKVGMSKKIADLRARFPLQYLHLLRAGYFEPIPVAWANQASNPLKFSIEASAGWRGITPAWRGYEDTAEERLYWVLNHREGSVGMRMKPDMISELEMARARMATAVEPPPLYFSASDTCHLQHTSAGYSKQVMPPPFRPFDRPEQSTDDTMILLDVSGSMDFEPVRPNYNQYLITSYARSTQPKNKDVARAIIRRFTDAMANHDHQFRGYDLTTFSNKADFIGTINHRNLDDMWRRVRLGGGTRVMTGWQMVKARHFEKHSESATYHPVYGWQAGPDTPMLRLLLLLDGEATDMDEFELDLLGLSWAHVTIFLIGVDGCPHHHRHANELQRISDVNHHISFVDAQGNCPERFVTHELLKRHLGYDITMQEFEQMEELPPYVE